MTDKDNNRLWINERLDLLRSSDRRERLLASAELGDLVQYAAERPEVRMLGRELLALIAKELLTAIVSEHESSQTRESMLNALSWASCRDTDVPWDQLAGCLAQFDEQCLEHALVILGNTGNMAYSGVLQQYLRSPSPSIRSTAIGALGVLNLGGCRPPARESNGDR
jgi:HEAT repeat protein